LRAVRAVVSDDGKPLKAFPLEVTQVAAQDSVFELNRMLEVVMEHGTGPAARSVLPPNLVVAGKSGTSSELRDSWFAGFSGSHVAVVWVGYDDNRNTGFTGSAGALTVWARLMAGLDTTTRNAPMPDSLTSVNIEFKTGQRAETLCGDEIVAVAVPLGAEPAWKPGCENGAPSLMEKAGEWLRDMIRH